MAKKSDHAPTSYSAPLMCLPSFHYIVCLRVLILCWFIEQMMIYYIWERGKINRSAAQSLFLTLRANHKGCLWVCSAGQGSQLHTHRCHCLFLSSCPQAPQSPHGQQWALQLFPQTRSWSHCSHARNWHHPPHSSPSLKPGRTSSLPTTTTSCQF